MNEISAAESQVSDTRDDTMTEEKIQHWCICENKKSWLHTVKIRRSEVGRDESLWLFNWPNFSHVDVFDKLIPSHGLKVQSKWCRQSSTQQF